MSLRLALEQLGLGPCYHMESVLEDMAAKVPHWNAALAGNADWQKTFSGYQSAVDWPTAAFWQDLIIEYPDARIIHSTRDVEGWYKSISETILAVLLSPDKWPDEQREWLEMACHVVIDKSFSGKTDRDSIIKAFNTHEAAIKDAIPANNLLVFQAKDGWGPLCEFLGRPVPDAPYPRTNSREEFFALLAQGNT